MGTKEQKKYEKSSAKQHAREKEEHPETALMRFKEAMFYNDMSKPIFEADTVYELEGADWIQRWRKRGGEVVNAEDLEKEDKKALKDSDGPVAMPESNVPNFAAPAPEVKTASVVDGVAVASVDGIEKDTEEKDNKGHKNHKDHGKKHK